MDYEKLHKDTITKLQEMVNSGKITVETARGICADFIPESEDERIRKSLLEYLHTLPNHYAHSGVCAPEWIAWLEKQGEQKPNDEIEQKGMNLVEEEMTPFQKKVFCIIDTTIEEEQGLKQVCDELLALASNEIKQNPAWSEEDEVKINRIVACLENLNVADNDILLKDVAWLKSLRPQNRWKPSDLQIQTLEFIVEYHAFANKDRREDVIALLSDLKKLKEE